ncbi:hypothetical protein AOLI_G00154010 [Acnodon oligacanthus]
MIFEPLAGSGMSIVTSAAANFGHILIGIATYMGPGLTQAVQRSGGIVSVLKASTLEFLTRHLVKMFSSAKKHPEFSLNKDISKRGGHQGPCPPAPGQLLFVMLKSDGSSLRSSRCRTIGGSRACWHWGGPPRHTPSKSSVPGPRRKETSFLPALVAVSEAGHMPR